MRERFKYLFIRDEGRTSTLFLQSVDHPHEETEFYDIPRPDARVLRETLRMDEVRTLPEWCELLGREYF